MEKGSTISGRFMTFLFLVFLLVVLMGLVINGRVPSTLDAATQELPVQMALAPLVD